MYENLKLEQKKTDVSLAKINNSQNIEELAKKYGLNIADIEKKVLQRRAYRKMVPSHSVNIQAIFSPTIKTPPLHNDSSSSATQNNQQTEIQTDVEGLRVFE